MTMREAAELIGLTYEDIANEDVVAVMEMFGDLGMYTTLVDKESGATIYLWAGEKAGRRPKRGAKKPRRR